MCSVVGLGRSYRPSAARGECRLRQWGGCMALSDHVGWRTNGAIPWRHGAGGFAQADRAPFRFSNDNQRQVDDDGPAEELDCLRGVLAPQVLRAAERRARWPGTG